jgi:HSP20 family molecular chaperone IbpA
MTNLIRNPLLSELDHFFNLPSYHRPGPKFVTNLNYRVRSEGNASIVEVEVPGVEPSDVKVKLEGRQLSVDSPKGSIFFSLGTRIDASHATAKLKHGLLTITIPKREASVVEIEVLSD